MFVNIKIRNNSPYPDTDYRAVVVGVLAKSIMDGRNIPGRVDLQIVPSPIRRVIDGKVKYLTGAIIVSPNGPSIIKVVAGIRDHSDVMQTVFHEVSHLVRHVNGDMLETTDEEADNFILMYQTKPAVEHIAAILILDQHDELREIWKNGEDPGPSPVVRDPDTQAGVRL